MRWLSLRGVWMNPPRSCFINETLSRLLCSARLFALTDGAVFQADELHDPDPGSPTRLHNANIMQRQK